MAENTTIQGLKGFKILRPNTVVSDIIHYIEIQLPIFLSSSEFIDITKIKKNENQHSTAFCVFMTNGCKSRFCFTRENSQKGSSTIDIGVYKGSKQVFNIEAKILPTPLDAKRLEHEYVYGKGAGIQRFKDGQHGLDDENNPLSESGMIAYIKENDFQYWIEKINEWIVDSSWPSTEFLQEVSFKSTAKLISNHLRQDNTSITLHHFWVKI